MGWRTPTIGCPNTTLQRRRPAVPKVGFPNIPTLTLTNSGGVAVGDRRPGLKAPLAFVVPTTAAITPLVGTELHTKSLTFAPCSWVAVSGPTLAVVR